MIKTDPNPQGKGLVPVLENMSRSRPAQAVTPKQIDQIAGELFTSMFILESEFSFKPVVGKTYYLYRRGQLFRMSLIAPEEWIGEQFGKYIGECTLGRDITWTLMLDESASKDKELIEYISGKREEFERSLEDAGSLDEILPQYYESFPFYRRLFASALAYSLGVSMELSGIRTLTYSEAKGLIDHQPEN